MQFFKDYQIYTEDTEPPKNFHVWTGIGTISALLGRKCYVPQGFFTVHPNLYITLVGPAGVKKSSSMNIGKQILKSIKGFPLAPASTTREALLQTLEENKITYRLNNRELFYHQCSAFVTEMQEFIGGKHINQAMVGIMTALWDEADFQYKTANKKEVVIPAVYFTLLGCCTTEWISTKLKSDIITDGFSRRVILVMEDQRAGYQPWPVMTERKEKAMERMCQEAKRMHNLKGKFRVTDQFLDYWKNEFYPRMNKEADEQDRYVQNYYSTKHILIIKVCMCLAAAVDDQMLIDSEMLKLVEKIFYSTEETLMKVFQGLGDNTLAPHRARILQQIEEVGKMSRSEIETEFARDVAHEDIETLLSSLQTEGSIELGRGGVYVAKQHKQPRKSKNLFDLLNEYERPNESSSESNKAELKRMVDSVTYYSLLDNENRKEDLKKGILATKERLERFER